MTSTKKTYYRFIFGITVAIVGVVLSFFDKTNSIGMFGIGFGLSYGAMTIGGD